MNTALGDEVTGLWIDPRRGRGACHVLSDPDEPLARAVGYVAGSVAVSIAGAGDRPQYNKSDLGRAVRLIGKHRIPEAERHARRLLRKYAGAVNAVAQALVDYGELSGKTVRRIFDDQPAHRAA